MHRVSRMLLLLLGLWLGALALPGAAQQTCQTGGKAWRPIDYETLTIDNLTPVGINVAKLPQAATEVAMAFVSVVNATIRIRFAGDPMQDDGHEIAAGSSTYICGKSVIKNPFWRPLPLGSGGKKGWPTANALLVR